MALSAITQYWFNRSLNTATSISASANYFRRGIEPDSGIRGKRMNITEHEMRGLLTGKCLPGDMRVNEELPAYLVRKFAEAKAERDALAAKGMELCREAAYVYDKYNVTQMPDMDFVDCQTIQEFSDLAAKLRAGEPS